MKIRTENPISDLDAPPYRQGVGMMVLNERGQVWIGRRRTQARAGSYGVHFAWQMPQGGLDPGEDPYQAALRELREETNITSVSLLAECPKWLTYDVPEEMRGQAFRGRFRGQTQKWYAFRFEGDESEIQLDSLSPGAHEPEFDAWRWEHLEKLPDLIIPFKKSLYEEVIDHFAYLVEDPKWPLRLHRSIPS